MSGQTFEPIKMLVCIVNRGEGKQVTELCTENGLSCHIQLLGKGTADSQMLSMLGLGENEKDIVIVTVAASMCSEVMAKITSRLHLGEPGRGIAFSVPFSGFALQSDSYYALAGLTPPSTASTEEAI